MDPCVELRLYLVLIITAHKDTTQQPTNSRVLIVYEIDEWLTVGTHVHQTLQPCGEYWKTGLKVELLLAENIELFRHKMNNKSVSQLQATRSNCVS